MRVLVLACGTLVLSWTATYAQADGFGIGNKDATLGVYQGQLVSKTILPLGRSLEFENTWDLSLRESRFIKIRGGRSPYDHWSLGYDPAGKDPKVFAAKPETPGIVQWKITYDDEKKASAVQANEGPLAGWYLTPGEEKIEVEVRGKKIDLGTRPILAKEPYYFDVHDVSP